MANGGRARSTACAVDSFGPLFPLGPLVKSID